ncbi:MAG: hypothetical protein ACK559_09570, partial [bacterium]
GGRAGVDQRVEAVGRLALDLLQQLQQPPADVLRGPAPGPAGPGLQRGPLGEGGHHGLDAVDQRLQRGVPALVGLQKGADPAGVGVALDHRAMCRDVREAVGAEVEGGVAVRQRQAPGEALAGAGELGAHVGPAGGEERVVGRDRVSGGGGR